MWENLVQDKSEVGLPAMGIPPVVLLATGRRRCYKCA